MYEAYDSQLVRQLHFHRLCMRTEEITVSRMVVYFVIYFCLAKAFRNEHADSKAHKCHSLSDSKS